MAKDYYSILGVNKGASKEEIKKAFHRLAHQHHPDKEGGDEAKFKEINEAYQVLSDDKKRTAYDQFGSDFVAGGGGGAPGGGFSGFQGFDFGNFSGQGVEFDLGDIFGDFFGGGSRARRKRKGSDIHADVIIGLREAAFGTSKTISLNKTIICTTCGGNGGEPGSKTKRCTNCDGSGKVVKVQATILGQFQTATTCPHCMGEGSVPETSCRTCRGQGIEKQIKEITVAIPAGIDNGQMIRVTGEGEAIGRGGVNGDLFVTIHVEEHPQFSREGPHLKTTVSVTYSQAALGDKVEFTTLDDKKIKLKIPAGTQSGKVLCISGKGIGGIGSARRGDLLVTIQVRTPTRLSRKQKQLLEELAREGL